jgi:hypothetical protein
VSTSKPLSRRRVLRGAALGGAGVVLAGCAPAGGSPTASEPDVRRVTAAITDEQAVLEVCRAALAGHSTLRPVLAPIVASQHAHIAALRSALPSPAAMPRRRHRPLHAGRREALQRVRSSLLDAQRHRRADALAAGSGLLARLFASMSAAHAVAAAQDAVRP